MFRNNVFYYENFFEIFNWLFYYCVKTTILYDADASFLYNKVGIGTCIKDHCELFVKAKTTNSPMLSMKEDETYDLLRAIK